MVRMIDTGFNEVETDMILVVKLLEIKIAHFFCNCNSIV